MLSEEYDEYNTDSSLDNGGGGTIGVSPEWETLSELLVKLKFSINLS